MKVVVVVFIILFYLVLPGGLLLSCGTESTEGLDSKYQEPTPTLACDYQLAPVSRVGGRSDVAFAGYLPADCTPDRLTWDTLIVPVVEERCGACHGQQLDFGAPLSLVDYDSLLAGEPGERPVDRIARRAVSGTMPPPGTPQLEHQELDLMVEWATCGEVHPDHTLGLKVDREPYAASRPENLQLPTFDLLADFDVDRETLDVYQCFSFDVPIDEPRLIRRLQVVLDESRVLHHMVVLHDPEGESTGQPSFECSNWPRRNTPALWGWAPGGGAFEFEEGGFRLDAGDRIVVQIHYNNGAGLEGVKDQTGLRVFHGPIGEREWSMQTIGPFGFDVPQGESVVCGVSHFSERTRLLAGGPHMHQMGAEYHASILRTDGTEEPFINLTGWNFESQVTYRYDTVLEPGDRFRSWCGYRNDTGKDASFGLGTGDEMCFHFMYLSPE